MPKQKVDLYDMHENVAEYFQMILRIHADMVKTLQQRFADDEISAEQFNIDIRLASLAPAVLTVITQFLKTNDIKYIPDSMEGELKDYEKTIEKLKKSGTSISDLDPHSEIN